MSVYDKIEELAKKRKLSIRKLCNKAEITDSAYHNGKENFALKVKTIIKFADILQVSPAYFFEEDGKPEDYKVKDKPGAYNKKDAIKAILQIELTHDKKDQVLKFIFGNSNLEILNK